VDVVGVLCRKIANASKRTQLALKDVMASVAQEAKMMRLAPDRCGSISRRSMLGVAAAAIASPSLAEECHLGPPAHEKGPLVFLDYDQIEINAAYDNSSYEPLLGQVTERLTALAEEALARLGQPQRFAYGPTPIEKLDFYRTSRTSGAPAPIFVFIHGGTWRTGTAKRSAYAAELFVDRGAHYFALDFINVIDASGDLRIMAQQVRRAIAWVYRNAQSFGGDPRRLYVGGHSSGGHLCGMALVTDWEQEFGLPPDVIQGGLCMSGIYDLKPVRLSWRSGYIRFDDAMEHEMSPIRHLDKLRAAVTISFGTFETPEFQRQGRVFAAAIEQMGRPVKAAA
jgi:arylformamidase